MYRLLLAACLCTAVSALGRTQSVGIKGTLVCNDKPAAGVKIKLYDEDKLSPDEHMATTETDSQGYFLLKGHAENLPRSSPSSTSITTATTASSPASGN